MFARSHFLTRSSISLSIPLLFFSLNPQAQTTDTYRRTRQIEGMPHLVAVKIVDNDPAPPTLSIYDLTVREDTKVGELRVELSRPSDEVVTVRYTTSDLTAEAPSDYVSSRGMMVFEPQATHGVILVGIVDDAIAEGQEQLSVTLSKPKNAVIDRGVATLTIVDNDVE